MSYIVVINDIGGKVGASKWESPIMGELGAGAGMGGGWLAGGGFGG